MPKMYQCLRLYIVSSQKEKVGILSLHKNGTPLPKACLNFQADLRGHLLFSKLPRYMLEFSRESCLSLDYIFKLNLSN